jgi:flagellar hook protein FlgE
LYFSATAVPNQWNVNMTIDGQSAGAAQTLTYNTAGALVSTSEGTIAVGGGKIAFGLANPPDGAQAMNISLNFGNSTQYGGDFGVTSLTQNGYATARPNSANWPWPTFPTRRA